MIDGPTYRMSEQLARRQSPSWRLKGYHIVPFVGWGFPGNFDSNLELSEIVDTFHEGRFESFIKEWNGLTRAQLERLVNAILDNLKFQRLAFPNTKPLVALSSMTSSFSIYEKLKCVNPTFATVAEIGPGTGYLSFFLNDHKPLTMYAQTEAAESLYVLQSMVNDHCFPLRTNELALPPPLEAVAKFEGLVQVGVREVPEYIDLPSTPICAHYPWWRLGDLLGQKFDIVMSNANLAEIQGGGFETYLQMIPKIMQDDGYFFAQSLGGEIFRKHEDLEQPFFNAGLAPLLFVHDGIDQPVKTPSGKTANKHLPLGPVVLVKKGHPDFDQYYKRENYNPRFISGHPICERIFEAPDEPGINPSREDIIEQLKLAWRTRSAI